MIGLVKTIQENTKLLSKRALEIHQKAEQTATIIINDDEIFFSTREARHQKFKRSPSKHHEKHATH
jgi:hypothetical protein